MSAAHVEGFLEKKSGGKSASPSRFKKAFLEKWDKRFFVLSASGTELRYYHTAEEAHYQAQKPLGAVECAAAKVFLKAEQGELWAAGRLGSSRRCVGCRSRGRWRSSTTSGRGSPRRRARS